MNALLALSICYHFENPIHKNFQIWMFASANQSHVFMLCTLCKSATVCKRTRWAQNKRKEEDVKNRHNNRMLIYIGIYERVKGTHTQKRNRNGWVKCKIIIFMRIFVLSVHQWTAIGWDGGEEAKRWIHFERPHMDLNEWCNIMYG